MSELPESIDRLYSYFTVAALAHETSYELYSAIVFAGGDLKRPRALLDEGARIALVEMSRVADDALKLASRYVDLEVLDPPAAAALLEDLADVLAAVEPQLKALRARQNELAAELARLMDAEQ